MAKTKLTKFIGAILLLATMLSYLASCTPKAISTMSPLPTNTLPGTTSPEGIKNTVEKYEALMTDLNNFPLVFKYNDKEFSGFKGFEEKSREGTRFSRRRRN